MSDITVFREDKCTQHHGNTYYVIMKHTLKRKYEESFYYAIRAVIRLKKDSYANQDAYDIFFGKVVKNAFTGMLELHDMTNNSRKANCIVIYKRKAYEVRNNITWLGSHEEDI